MIKLYQFASGYGLPNFSPFCMKLETYLRMTELDYQIVNLTTGRQGPKGKLPFINDDGKIIADTEFIINYLNKHYSIDLDSRLTLEQKAISTAFQGMLDERFYWTVVYSRWIDPQGWPKIKHFFFDSMPPVVKQIAPKVARTLVKKQLHAQGTGRHSLEQIYQIGKECLDALSTYLGDKKYFHGDHVSLIDCCMFAYVATIIQSPFGSPLKEHSDRMENLKRYNQLMYENYFPELIKI